jgi:hypothetical protein
VYGVASAAMSRWCSCFLGNDRTTRKRERRWFRLLCLGKQQSIDLLFIIDHYSLFSALSISLPLFLFFCQQRLYAHALLFAYTCHYAMLREHKHTCTNEADDDDSGAIIFKRKVFTLQWHVFIKKKEKKSYTYLEVGTNGYRILKNCNNRCRTYGWRSSNCLIMWERERKKR